MNIRTTRNPIVRHLGQQLRRLNDRHPWNHNAHFHPWILRSLPDDATRVLDVGCGHGDLLAALAEQVPRVEGIDPDPAMAQHAQERFHDEPRVQVARAAFEEFSTGPALEESFDAITMVASLHHMELEAALSGAARLLRPGGRLLAVTLVDPRGPIDTAWDVANALSNPLIGMVKHPRPAPRRSAGTADTAGTHHSAGTTETVDAQAPMPVKESHISSAELRRRASMMLPDARIRRREGFRVTLRWEKPREPRP